MGRPPIEIDANQVYELAKIGCRIQEIADFFGCSHDTIERRFALELDKGRADLKMSLRQWQLQAAKGGNVVMQIWLGKQLLGQLDRSQLDINKIPDEVFLEEAKRRLLTDGSKPEGNT
jgi:hypothetical protein